MSLIGIFYGSDTGNTENIAKMLAEKIGPDLCDVYDIAKCTKEDLENYNVLLLGIPTWYYGEAQADWEDFFPTLQAIDFNDRVCAIFGCGDQEDYADYFCDAMGEVANIVEANGAVVIGHTSHDGYTFTESKALIDSNTLVGLCIDEDRQPELTEERVNNWVAQLKNDLGI
ncbi:flavodoxin [Psittacicella melopsittaci]|uniref:Flavodoxin n=1 Tax=Psittacicella melopsittaci TaxID=2028576 RepID=A0A3A1Y2Z6_9GAMM|nr:flavodoxin FldA [Psittacicella melopsittaci]RIY31800.1 flavodoxin [Psittacicella melopsittaci]